MEIVVLTANDVEHRYVVNSLSKQLGEHLALVVVEESRKNIGYSELRRLTKKYSALVLLERITTKIVRKILKTEKKIEQALKDILGNPPDIKSSYPRNKLLITESINSRECYDRLNVLEPDYILVYGTSIVSNRILELSKSHSLNLHTGISPYYRGSSTAFWPLYHRDTNMIGATVHLCTADIDGGSIVKRANAKLDLNDNVHTAFAKAVSVGSTIYSEVAEQIVSSEKIKLEAQDFTLGKEYKFSDRTFVHELIMEFRFRTGLIAKEITKNNRFHTSFNKK